MMILWQEKLAVLAVPKTGTTALEAALAPHAAVNFATPPNVKHITAHKFNRFIRPYLESTGLENVETMAVMREPVAWLGSWYRYRNRPFLRGKPNSTQGISFDTFVEAYLQDEGRPEYANVGSQARFLQGRGKELMLDHLFRYESLSDAVAFLEGRMGKRLKLDQSNVSPKMKLVLSESVEAQLRRHRSKDFELYDSIRG